MNRSTMMRLLILSFVPSTSNALESCRGQGPRYGVTDFKCNHDHTHRVCAELINPAESRKESGTSAHVCSARKFAPKDQTFWQLTSQTEWEWKDKVCNAPNPGTNWCICMWAFASMLKTVECDDVVLVCEATDVDFILEAAKDQGFELTDEKECLKKKCPDQWARAVKQ